MDYETYTVDEFLMDDSFLAYCRGNDPAAVAFWETWQSRKAPDLVAFREAERLCRMLNGHQPRLEESLRELEALIDKQSQPTKVVAMPVPTRSSGDFQWWAVAAAVLLVSALGWFGYRFWSNQYVRYETAYNQQRTVQLPDGSRATLNSHSMLRHRRNEFSGTERSVELTGEGFFSVRHLTGHTPFRVVTNGNFDVLVLGTEFSVYNRPALHRVVLNTGRVQVRFHDNSPPLVLNPGQLLEMDNGTRRPRQRNVRADRYNAWLRNQLVFDNTPLTEAIHTVEDQFGITVRIDGADPNKTVTGILLINNPETVLSALAALVQLNVRQTDSTFILSKK